MRHIHTQAPSLSFSSSAQNEAANLVSPEHFLLSRLVVVEGEEEKKVGPRHHHKRHEEFFATTNMNSSPFPPMNYTLVHTVGPFQSRSVVFKEDEEQPERQGKN